MVNDDESRGVSPLPGFGERVHLADLEGAEGGDDPTLAGEEPHDDGGNSPGEEELGQEAGDIGHGPKVTRRRALPKIQAGRPRPHGGNARRKLVIFLVYWRCTISLDTFCSPCQTAKREPATRAKPPFSPRRWGWVVVKK